MVLAVVVHMVDLEAKLSEVLEAKEDIKLIWIACLLTHTKNPTRAPVEQKVGMMSDKLRKGEIEILFQQILIYNSVRKEAPKASGFKEDDDSNGFSHGFDKFEYGKKNDEV